MARTPGSSCPWSRSRGQEISLGTFPAAGRDIRIDRQTAPGVPKNGGVYWAPLWHLDPPFFFILPAPKRVLQGGVPLVGQLHICLCSGGITAPLWANPLLLCHPVPTCKCCIKISKKIFFYVKFYLSTLSCFPQWFTVLCSFR